MVAYRLSLVEGRRAYGLLFLSISGAIAASSAISLIISPSSPPFYYYAIVWVAVFAAVFGSTFRKLKKALSVIRSRMKGATSWSTSAKMINGLSWAAPFVVAGILHSMYQYMILLGIGLGNFTTYMYIKKYANIANREQLIVSIISLAAIPVAFAVNQWLFVSTQGAAVLISRLLIALSYGVGGIFAFYPKEQI